MKSRIVSTIAITILWSLLDFIFHAKILHPDYILTSNLWRPMSEMNQIGMTLVTVLSALVFVIIYCRIVSDKTFEKGIKLGILTGILMGIGAASSYLHMPITIKIATVWFLANLIKLTLAGAVVGKLVTTNCCNK